MVPNKKARFLRWGGLANWRAVYKKIYWVLLLITRSTLSKSSCGPNGLVM